MFRFYRRAKVVMLVVAASGVWSIAPALAVEEIKLTMITGFARPNTVVDAFLDTYAPAVDRQLAMTGNYRIAWNMATGTIVKPRGELEAIERGLGEIGMVPTVFHADKLPLYEISFKTPFTTKNMDLIARITKRLEGEYPAYRELWAKFNQIPLFPTGALNNYILITKDPITSFAELKGRKIGAAGPNLPWVTAAGATGVQTNLGDFYNSLKLGIFTDGIAWAQAAGAFKLCEPAPYILDAGFGANQAQVISVNRDAFDALPEQVRRALVDNAEAWHIANGALIDAGDKAAIELCTTQYGTKITALSDKDRREWAFALPNIGKEWASAVDAKGLPGTAILAKYMSAMRAEKEPIVRHWDRE